MPSTFRSVAIVFDAERNSRASTVEKLVPTAHSQTPLEECSAVIVFVEHKVCTWVVLIKITSLGPALASLAAENSASLRWG